MDLGGAGLLAQYEQSMQKVLSAHYPQEKWLPWKFHQISANEWQNNENSLKFMENVAKELQIKEKNDWYNISKEVKKMLFLADFSRKYKNLKEEEVS